MSQRYFDILSESGHKGNFIPSGRQLPRTPPLVDVKKHLDFCEEFENIEAGMLDQDDSDQNRTFDFNTLETKTEPEEPSTLLKGMKGYQLTPSDLEFIKKMQEEKVVKKLQGDLEEVQRLLKKEMMAAELVCASMEKAEAEFNKFPSCEEVREWLMVVLEVTSPSTDLTDTDTKSLLAMVTEENVQRVVGEKKVELARMRKMLANKRRKEAKEREQLEKQIASEQLEIKRLMSQLFELKSELAQEEEAFKALEMQINKQEVPEIKAEKEETSGELQAAKSQVKPQRKERKKAVKAAEKLHDATNHSKSTRRTVTDSQSRVKDDGANKKSESSKTTKQTSAIKAVKVQQEKAEKESSPPESVQAARGRRKPPGAAQTSASQPKNQSKVKTGETHSTDQESQNTGLRRSKRIASRR